MYKYRGGGNRGGRGPGRGRGRGRGSAPPGSSGPQIGQWFAEKTKIEKEHQQQGVKIESASSSTSQSGDIRCGVSRSGWKRGGHRRRWHSSAGGGGHPPGLRGREIGLWYRDNPRKKEEQRADVLMTETREKSLTKMLESWKDAPSSRDQASGSSMENYSDNFYLPEPLVEDDELLNEELIKDLKRKKSSKTYKQMAVFRENLPSYKMKDKIVDLINSNQVVVISGETGCGKTTQVAQFILDDAIMKGKGSTCRIICTQPRRISAISIAERVAEERGETVGEPGSTGYQIRLDSVLPRERGSILFCTTGVILRWLMSDSDLSRASHIIIDEIHERSTHSDFLLIVVRDILPRRPELKVVLMSATLNAEMFSKYFNNCPMLNIPGFTFPVVQHFLDEIVSIIDYKCAPGSGRVSYYGRRKRDEKEEQERKERKWKEYLRLLRTRGRDSSTIRCLESMNFDKIDYDLVEKLLVYIGINMQDGAVLVFLPGWQDISKVHDLLKKNPLFLSGHFLILPLHSIMPTVNQRQIFDRPPRGVRKIILSTSLAETSITIDDVVYVIDCGKTKEQNFDADKQLTTLKAVWNSKASCVQRRGRAGRVQEGVCFYLFTEYHFEEMAEYQQPEILRTPLEEVCLQVKSLKLGMVQPFLSKALEPPAIGTIQQAIATLMQLDAFDSNENLTPLGHHLARLPVHPRIGKIILFGAIMSCLDPVLTIASSMGYRDPYVVPLNMERQADESRRRFSQGTQSDHLALYEAFNQWESASSHGNAYQFCWDNFLSHSILLSIKNMKTQFAEHLCSIGFISTAEPNQETANYNSNNKSLIKAVLCAGFYPNVISVYQPSSRRPKLSIRQDGRNVKVEVHPKSVNCNVPSFQSNWLIYMEKVKSTKIFIHDCSPVSPYSLLFFGGEISMATVENQEVVTVDNWISFNCRRSVATLVQKLREHLKSLLEEKIRHPGLRLTYKDSTEDRSSILIKTIIELITSE
ncbi:ATP-dependent DNA/RNA helicase DHX36-like [Dendronephthya gigantea]|uniref:ATP-dependent DNA/RNA helicase DHX36-like n=1 Tax=Dendronephthya gigantea TaxID=151771 RepID=UPI00106D1507|nr:ATP-dependent DNA/RNA helicase DHX36-like [Dendronephthya gigantea]